MDSLTFTFNNEYCAHNEDVDYFCEWCDDTGQLTVYVDEYDVALLDLSDEGLCEELGMDSDCLIHVVRPGKN